MASARDDLVEIDAAGTSRPLGETASLRMQARSGHYRLWPGPADLVMMRREAVDASDAPRACLLSGEIPSVGALCDVIAFLAQTGRRGELIVATAEASRSMYFDQGHVVGARSTAIGDRLGEVLYRHGVLTRPQVEECAAAAAAGALRFGEAAVRPELVTRERLFALMARQVEEIFYATLFEGTGVFYFLESFDDAVLAARHQLSATTLIREGVRRAHETRFFRARIPSELHVPARTEGRTPPESDPLGVYAAIDGARSVVDLCRLLGAGEFEVTRAIFQLVQTNHVAIKPPRLDPEAVVGVFNQAIALLLCELDAMDQGDDVRAQLAQFAGGEPRFTTLLDGAGPADDGTLDAARVAQNLARASTPERAEQHLASCLYEYASYALFLARPPLHRMEQARGEANPRVSKRVTALLEPIAPGQPGAKEGAS